MMRLEGATTILEEKKMMLENTSQLIYVMQAIKEANNAIKINGQGIKVEDLEKMREESGDIKDDQEEISNFFKDYNEDFLEDIEEELKYLEKEMSLNDTGVLPLASKEKQQKIEKVKNKEEELNNFINN